MQRAILGDNAEHERAKDNARRAIAVGRQVFGFPRHPTPAVIQTSVSAAELGRLLPDRETVSYTFQAQHMGNPVVLVKTLFAAVGRDAREAGWHPGGALESHLPPESRISGLRDGSSPMQTYYTSGVKATLLDAPWNWARDEIALGRPNDEDHNNREDDPNEYFAAPLKRWGFVPVLKEYSPDAQVYTDAPTQVLWSSKDETMSEPCAKLSGKADSEAPAASGSANDAKPILARQARLRLACSEEVVGRVTTSTEGKAFSTEMDTTSQEKGEVKIQAKSGTTETSEEKEETACYQANDTNSPVSGQKQHQRKVFFVTGATGGGLEQAITELLLEDERNVVYAGVRSSEKLSKTFSNLVNEDRVTMTKHIDDNDDEEEDWKTKGRASNVDEDSRRSPRLRFVKLDLTGSDDEIFEAIQLVEEAERTEARSHGRDPEMAGIDVLISAAGIGRNWPLECETTETIAECLRINLSAPITLNQAVLASMKRRSVLLKKRQSSVINKDTEMLSTSCSPSHFEGTEQQQDEHEVASSGAQASALPQVEQTAALPSTSLLRRKNEEQSTSSTMTRQITCAKNGVQSYESCCESVQERDRFHIINVSSINGLVVDTMTEIYAAAKFGLVGFSASLRKTLELGYADGPKPIYITTVCPGPMDTPALWESAQTITEYEQQRRTLNADGNRESHIQEVDDITKALIAEKEPLFKMLKEQKLAVPPRYAAEELVRKAVNAEDPPVILPMTFGFLEEDLAARYSPGFLQRGNKK
ncbi:unnamed protein product [Amoebophrya sp. A25]|nr:unnamed protein product [Amoebophrya sp. A25]|eukprot:GSA25T00026634001.1